MIPRRALALLAVCLLYLQVANLPAAARPLDSEIKQKQDELENVEDQLESVRREIRDAARAETDLLSQIKTVDHKLSDSQEKVSTLQGQLDALGKSKTKLQQLIDETTEKLLAATAQFEASRAEVDADQKILAERARGLYRTGRVDWIEVLLKAEDFKDLLNRTYFLGLILRQDRELLERARLHKQEAAAKQAQIDKQKRTLLVQREELEGKQQRVGAIKKQQVRQRNTIQRAMQEKEQLLTRVQTDKELAERSEQELKQSSKKLEQLIQSLERKKGGNGGGAVIGKGGLAWPTAGPLTSNFGMRKHPILDSMRMHEGIDIGAPIGQAIRAAKGGEVIVAGWYNGYGKTVVIDHGGGFSTLYAHTSALYTSEGQIVKGGQSVAAVGTSGMSTGPHLHFEVRVNGAPVDPMRYY